MTEIEGVLFMRLLAPKWLKKPMNIACSFSNVGIKVKFN